MAPLIAAAIPTLLKAAPSLLKLFSGSKKTEAVMEVLSIGKKALGVETEHEVLASLEKDPEQLRLFQEAVMKQDYRLEELFYEDKDSARQMYQAGDHAQADKIADRVMKWNFPFALIMFSVQCGVTWLVKDDATLVALTNSLCTLIISSLIAQCKEVCGFYFGSSLGSKLKNKREG